MNHDYEFNDQVVQDFFDNRYHDRGLMKWQGYYLSDHTSALKHEAVDRGKVVTARPQQALTEISAVLAQSYQTGHAITVQVNIANADSGRIAEFRGVVRGYLQTNIYLAAEVIPIELIRNAK